MRSIMQMTMKQFRLEKGLTYQQLADRTGLSKSTLQRYETGNIKRIPMKSVQLIAKALYIPMGVLMGQEEFESNSEDFIKLEPLEEFISSLGYQIKPLTENTTLDIVHRQYRGKYKQEFDDEMMTPQWEITTKSGHTFTVSRVEHVQLFNRIKNFIRFELKMMEKHNNNDEVE